MEFAFYFAAGVAVVATLRVITNTNPVHALLYLIVSLLAVSMCFFSLGAPFAGVLEIIVYAGAIMVLFVFVVMMLNLGPAASVQETSVDDPGHLGRSGDDVPGSAVASCSTYCLAITAVRPLACHHRRCQGRGHQPVRSLPAGCRTGLHAAVGSLGCRLPPRPSRGE